MAVGPSCRSLRGRRESFQARTSVSDVRRCVCATRGGTDNVVWRAAGQGGTSFRVSFDADSFCEVEILSTAPQCLHPHCLSLLSPLCQPSPLRPRAERVASGHSPCNPASLPGKPASVPTCDRSGVLQAAFTCPSPGMQPLPPCPLLVHLFASASAPLFARRLDRVLSLDLLHDVGFDLSDDDQFAGLCQLA